MAEFPAHLLIPLAAEVQYHDGALEQYSFIRINFQEFGDIPPDGEYFDGVLDLGYIRLPSKDLSALAGKSFDFPTQCERDGVYPGDERYGCIEGAIYLFSANQPVHVSRLEFGFPAGNQMPLRVESFWDLSSDAVGLNEFDHNFTVPLSLANVESEAPKGSFISSIFRRLRGE
jgi:hypothetical protein